MADAKKIVLKLDLHGNIRKKRKAMTVVSGIIGLDSIDVDMKSEKMVVIGSIDPVVVVRSLKKAGYVSHIESVGPAKQPVKKEPAAPPKPVDPMVEYWKSYYEYWKAYYGARCPHYGQHYYVGSVEDPIGCVIC